MLAVGCHGRPGDVLLVDLGTLELAHHAPAGEDEHPVAEPLELDGVRGEHDDAPPGGGRLAHHLVEVDARPGVDAARRLVGEQDPRGPEQRPGEQHLLLVSARQGGDAGLRRRRLDAEPLDLGSHQRAFAGAPDEAGLRHLAEREQRHVLAHREGQHHALPMAVAREVDDAGAAHPARPAESQCAAADVHPPAGRAHPGERPQERTLSVALDPGEPDDLAGLDVERDLAEARAGQVFDLEHRRGGLVAGAFAGKDLIDRAADDQPQDLAFGDSGRVEGAAGLAVAQDGDAVGDALDLGQPMGDVDDRGSLVADGADVREQPLALDAREGLRRLIEDQHLGVEREGLGDLDQLAIGRAQVADALGRVDLGADRRELLAGPRGRPRHPWSARSRHREDHVLGHREVFEDRQVLVDDPHAERLGHRR